MPKPRVLLIGWDAADWKVIQPLLQAGQMPNLARLIAGGVHGNIATIYPVLSPMLWTSIATGKRAYKHGVHGFTEPLPDGSGVRPCSLLSRKTKAVWNILNQNGHRSLVVGWWPSHPAEPINGVMVSNHFQQPVFSEGPPRPLPAGTVHPAALSARLAELRVSPLELSGEFIRPFVPNYDRVDQAKDKRLHTLGKIISETVSIHSVATELLATQPWDFAGIYYAGIDHFEHAFMSYHPPRLPWVSEEDFALYHHVIANAYCYHDAMLGALLGYTDEHTTVILLSDHGFHPDHLRPGYIPAEPAGPAVEHRHFGILCLKGPDLKVNEQIYGAGLLDVCPTLLTLFGLPPGADMDGKVLSAAFKSPPTVTPIPSWDTVAGDAGTHPPEAHLDTVASAEAFRQLVELGYVAPPGATAKETVDECVRELKYNLARAYRDGNCCGEAAALAEELWTRWPKEHRFGILLIDTLGPLRQIERRRAAIEELGRRLERFQLEAQTALASRQKEEQGTQSPMPVHADDAQQRRARFEERQLRELANGRPLLLEWFQVSQALLEQRPADARRYLQSLLEAENADGAMSCRVATALGELGDLDQARQLLETALEAEPENAAVHAQLAAIHFRAGRLEQTAAAAAESLTLVYFQPGLHALLGHVLMEMKRFKEAEQELLVAVSQTPRNLAAHESLARLYRDHLPQPADAFAHEGRARSLRHELAARKRAKENPVAARSSSEQAPPKVTTLAAHTDELPRPFASDVASAEVVTVVSGLPRSGTSMMMQLLAAGGRVVLADGKRQADRDNPLGYYEFGPALNLAKDNSWLPQARGKVVKLVAQLLPWLPATEHYQILFMERSLDEVLASQKAMLDHQGLHGAALGEAALRETYRAQINRVRAQLAHRPGVRLLAVNYADVLAEPGAAVERIAAFLGEPFERQAALAAIHPEMRRQKRELDSSLGDKRPNAE